MTKKPKLLCSICGTPIVATPPSTWDRGCNAQPINSGRCCEDCDWMYVIPARIRMFREYDAKQKKGD
jgi:hypothetical protein